MVFRREDDEDEITQSTYPSLRDAQKPAVIMLPGTMEEPDEDQPRMFKRVIIRISRRPPAPQFTSSTGDWGSIDLPWELLEVSDFGLYEPDTYFGSSYTEGDKSDSSYDEPLMIEDTFMKGFVCCGQTVNSLHGLLMHYEIHHVPQMPQPPREDSAPSIKAAVATRIAKKIEEEANRKLRRRTQLKTNHFQSKRKSGHLDLKSKDF